MLEAGGDPGGLGEDEGSLHESVRETKRRKVLHALEQAGGNYAQAAAIVGVHPNYFYRLVKNLGIKGKG
jgi:DNA-binding NtrC family response regulator